MKRFVLVLAAVLLASTFAMAKEEKLKEADVPKAVLEAVAKKYPKAKAVGYTKETDKEKKVLIEASIEDGKRKIDIDLSPEGKILAEEEQINAEAVPAEVKKGMADSKYSKWTVKRIEKVVTAENEKEPAYEFIIEDADNSGEVVFDKAGKIKEEEVKAKKKEGKKDEDGDEDEGDED